MEMICKTDGAICISKATSDSLIEWSKANKIDLKKNFTSHWVHLGADIEASSPLSGVPAEAEIILKQIRAKPTFLSVATLEPRKRHEQILDAFELLWARGHDIQLVFVGKPGWNVEDLTLRIERHPEAGKRFFWLRSVTDEYLQRIYATSICLIAASLNEGFGLPVVEAARARLPVIARDIAVFREIAGVGAHYFAGDAPLELATRIMEWIKLYESALHPQPTMVKSLTWEESTDGLIESLVHQNYPRRQILVDVSGVVQQVNNPTIQRFVKTVLKHWLTAPPDGWRVEPVYSHLTGTYRYANGFASNVLGQQTNLKPDLPVDIAPGDVFIVLDFHPEIQAMQAPFFELARRQGVTVKFMVYDMIYIQHPEYFDTNTLTTFEKWLNVVSKSDGAISPTHHVANGLKSWMALNQGEQDKPPRAASSFLCCDRRPTHHGSARHNTPDHNPRTAEPKIPTFLMVGTLPPRQDCDDILDSFEIAWASGENIALTIVCKTNSSTDDFLSRLRSHPELNRRLKWFESATDTELNFLYRNSTCLIAASCEPGQGLNIVEAALQGLPVIARDILPLREIASSHAYYFDPRLGFKSTDLTLWLNLYQHAMHPTISGLAVQSWDELASQILSQSLQPNAYGSGRYVPANPRSTPHHHSSYEDKDGAETSSSKNQLQIKRNTLAQQGLTTMSNQQLSKIAEFMNTTSGEKKEFLIENHSDSPLHKRTREKFELLIEELANQTSVNAELKQQLLDTRAQLSSNQRAHEFELAARTSLLFAESTGIARQAISILTSWLSDKPAQEPTIIQRLSFQSDNKLILAPTALRTNGKIHIRNAQKGHALYGPYCSLPEGSYIASIYFDGPITRSAYLEVSCDNGRSLLSRHRIRRSVASLKFSTRARIDGVEVRLFTPYDDFCAIVNNIEIIQYGAP
jgi:glycosyltransferase involved in cell wall biosynthesis